jgi:hypothetical protein
MAKTGQDSLEAERGAWFDALVQRRQHVGPKHLGAPAPGEAELR